MDTTAPVIEVDALRKTYRAGGLRRHVTALDGVTFDVRPGEVFALLGPNGAGKTTLIKVLLGIIRRTAGKATMLGYAAGDRRARARVGYLPEHLRVPRHQTARTALSFYGQLSGMTPSQIRPQADRLLQRVGLAGRDRESVKQFSKGMLQRLGLAQALLHDPTLLILDEPTDGLDPVGRSEVRSILQELRDEGRTVFLNSHLLQEVELVCDRVAIMDRGNLRYVGTIREMTPEHENEMALHVVGQPEALRAALPDAVPVPAGPADGEYRLAVPIGSQADIDRLVDRLRAANISIRDMTVKRRTLEDAFLRLVQPPSPAP